MPLLINKIMNDSMVKYDNDCN